MYLQKFEVKNKTALVTGAGKGIGKASAIALAEAGADLIIVSRTLNDLNKVKKQINKYLEIFKDHPYVFNLGHGILPETQVEMVYELVETVRNYK